MTSLKFNGEITLDEVFDRHRITIYDKVVDSIEKSYKDTSVFEVKIINIEINNMEYSINLGRDKFISGLENAITAYERVEEYEKCQRCLNIITEIKKEQNN